VVVVAVADRLRQQAPPRVAAAQVLRVRVAQEASELLVRQELTEACREQQQQLRKTKQALAAAVAELEDGQHRLREALL
jgi:cell division protein FtsB